MTFKERLINFFREILKLYTLFIWFGCMICNVIWFFGYGLFSGYTKSNLTDPDFSTIYKKNTHYGANSIRSYTPRVTKDVYNSNGMKIGSYETDGPKIYRSVKDNTEYFINVFKFAIYTLWFPLIRAIRLLLAFLSIFIGKFYIEDYPTTKYINDHKKHKFRKGIYTWFNVIVADKASKKSK